MRKPDELRELVDIAPGGGPEDAFNRRPGVRASRVYPVPGRNHLGRFAFQSGGGVRLRALCLEFKQARAKGFRLGMPEPEALAFRFRRLLRLQSAVFALEPGELSVALPFDILEGGPSSGPLLAEESPMS